MGPVGHIVRLGENAVLRYRTMSQRPDNELPEVFLGGYIASALYDQFHCSVHIEENYLHLARSCDVAITDDVISRVGNFRADIAMYHDEPPPEVVELKILDETTPIPAVLHDREKINTLSSICPVRGYIGLLICQTKGPLEDRISQVERILERKLHTGEMQLSRNREWHWCFGCAAVS